MKRLMVIVCGLALAGLAGLAWGQSPLCPEGQIVVVPVFDGMIIPVLPKTNHCVADATDSDDDGMADSWELAWFGDLEAANGLGMMTDYDEDGISDLEEYERGGNPTVNDASAFIAANRCQQRYLPFGGVFNSEDCGPIKHAGRVHDKGTDLHYNRARYYDAAVGQFLSPDPVRAVNPRTGEINLEGLLDPQRLNPYAYALNNPYRYQDPSGGVVTDILDVGFFALSLAAFNDDPSLLTGLDVVLDGVGLLPLVPGLGTIRRVGTEAIQRVDETFEIIEGVRRSKASQLLGHKTIKGQIFDSEGKLIGERDIPIESLRSPNRSTIDMSNDRQKDRYFDIQNSLQRGEPLREPISVRPGSRGIPVEDIDFDVLGE